MIVFPRGRNLSGEEGNGKVKWKGREKGKGKEGKGKGKGREGLIFFPRGKGRGIETGVKA